METTTSKQPKSCERLNVSFSRWPSSLHVAYSLLSKPIIHVFQVIRLGINVWVTAANELLASKRYTSGIVFLLVITPLSSVFYQVFDPEVLNRGWYYVNLYFLFCTLSPYLMLFFASIGVFLLFPVKCKTSYLATVFPAGYAITKLIYLTFFVESNEQFHQSASWMLYGAGLLTAIGFLLSADYLLYRKYHLKDGIECRRVGIMKMPGVDAETKLRLLELVQLEMENLNSKY